MSLVITKNHFIAEGAEREVYFHPINSNKCIKFAKSSKKYSKMVQEFKN